MPRGSEQLTQARKEEIVSACASLYGRLDFRDVTILRIAEQTSFTRTSIYNYFQTKEEIFLALLQREYETWILDLAAMRPVPGRPPVSDFAAALARTLAPRGCMLKLLSMNLYDMERSSRVENLVAFKAVYARALRAVEEGLIRFFPDLSAGARQTFLYAFFPFLFGVYPYTTATDKQRRAMEQAKVPAVRYTIGELVRSFAGPLLRGLTGTSAAEEGRRGEE